jgi:beta-lactamase regulating signal transducer with metallopeptidase domain
MIDSLAPHLEPLLAWLARTTWQAGILIGMVLLIQKVLGRRLGVRGCYCLWLLVLLRLALPWTIPSSASVYNLLPASPVQRYIVPTAPAKMSATDVLSYEVSPSGHLRPESLTADGSSGDSFPPKGQWPTRRRLEAGTILLLSLVWLIGFCSLSVWTVASGLRLRRLIRRGHAVTDRWILSLLEDAKRLVGIRANVGIVATDEVDSPALFGLLRPRLLLPRPTLAARDRIGLRHIFLHELAHLKRHDILIGHLASLLHLFHWFNPLLWFGLRHMRADRELACDSLALSVLPAEDAPAYGRTIVHQVEQLLTSRPRWVLVGLGGDRGQIKRRIALIAAPATRRTYRRSLPALVLAGVLAWAGLTDGFVSRTTWDDYARRDWPTTYQDRHANIQRCCIRNIETNKYLVVHGDKVTCDADEPGNAGLWEFRFDEISLEGRSDMYFYSVAARRYLATDGQGNLAVTAPEPNEAARWGVQAHPPYGSRMISHYRQGAYLRLNEQGNLQAEFIRAGLRGTWDIHTVWRVKTSDDPGSNPQWQREHIPGPD